MDWIARRLPGARQRATAGIKIHSLNLGAEPSVENPNSIEQTFQSTEYPNRAANVRELGENGLVWSLPTLRPLPHGHGSVATRSAASLELGGHGKIKAVIAFL